MAIWPNHAADLEVITIGLESVLLLAMAMFAFATLILKVVEVARK